MSLQSAWLTSVGAQGLLASAESGRKAEPIMTSTSNNHKAKPSHFLI